MEVEMIVGVIGVIFGVIILVGIILACCAVDKNHTYDNETKSYKEYKPASITRYQEIEIGDAIDKTIKVLGTNYTRDLLANGVVRLTWKKVYGGCSYGAKGTGMRFYEPQKTQKVVIKFKEDKVFEVRANNL